jgi:hypothetical protein
MWVAVQGWRTYCPLSSSGDWSGFAIPKQLHPEHLACRSAARSSPRLVAILFPLTHGLRFVRVQLFDRAARTLPGSVIRFGIDTMVSVIRGLRIGETSSVAKTGE